MQLVADNNKKQSYVSDFEYFGPEMPNDYSPHSIHSIFKDCLPLHEQNIPNRGDIEKAAFGASLLFNDKSVQDSIFTPLLMVNFNVLTTSYEQTESQL